MKKYEANAEPNHFWSWTNLDSPSFQSFVSKLNAWQAAVGVAHDPAKFTHHLSCGQFSGCTSHNKSLSSTSIHIHIAWTSNGSTTGHHGLCDLLPKAIVQHARRLQARHEGAPASSHLSPHAKNAELLLKPHESAESTTHRGQRPYSTPAEDASC